MILFSVEASKVALTKLLLAEEDLLNTYMGNNNNNNNILLLLLTKKLFYTIAKMTDLGTLHWNKSVRDILGI